MVGYHPPPPGPIFKLGFGQIFFQTKRGQTISTTDVLHSSVCCHRIFTGRHCLFVRWICPSSNEGSSLRVHTLLGTLASMVCLSHRQGHTQEKGPIKHKRSFFSFSTSHTSTVIPSSALGCCVIKQEA
ncbi:unnamed protein product [Pylaiella littoralis]